MNLSKFNAFVAELSEGQFDFQDLFTDFVRDEVTKAANEQGDLRDELESAHDKIGELEVSVINFQRLNKQRLDDNNWYEERHATIKDQRNQAEEKFDATKKRLEWYQGETGRVAAVVTKLSNENQELREQHTADYLEIRTLKEQAYDLENAAKKADAEITELTKTVEIWHNWYDSDGARPNLAERRKDRIVELEARLTKLAAELRHSEKYNEDANLTIAQLEEQVETLDNPSLPDEPMLSDRPRVLTAFEKELLALARRHLDDETPLGE